MYLREAYFKASPVGDYGTVDKDTGRFEKDGNIYENAATAALVADHPPEIAAADEKIVISSETEQKRDLNLSPQVIPGIAEASIKGQWKFKSGKTGALLVMSQPRSSWVPANALFKRLLEIPALKDKIFRRAKNRAVEDTVSLALLAKTPIPGAPLVSAGGELGGSWWSEMGAGVFRHGFTPLFALKRIRKPGFLSRGQPPEDIMCVSSRECASVLANAARCSWEDAEKPWWPLDEDGEEETFEDTGFIYCTELATVKFGHYPLSADLGPYWVCFGHRQVKRLSTPQVNTITGSEAASGGDTQNQTDDAPG
ncbi:hypothetical protein B0H14DRAFT_2560321 [Mycena olivaceomarginata]|nr:hypothetical protein B0H14DRAFT_2560321 [Mycena olivaceomarginata]